MSLSIFAFSVRACRSTHGFGLASLRPYPLVVQALLMLVVWVSTGKSQPLTAVNSTSAAEPAPDSTSLLGYSIVQVCTITLALTA